MRKAYSHHLRLLPPAEHIQGEPEQFWTLRRALLLAAFAAVVVIHHSNWSSSL